MLMMYVVGRICHYRKSHLVSLTTHYNDKERAELTSPKNVRQYTVSLLAVVQRNNSYSFAYTYTSRILFCVEAHLY